MTKATATVREIIDTLETFATTHGDETPVFIHDADTCWPLAVHPANIRYGLNDIGDGEENAVMIGSIGYYGEYNDFD